MKANPKAKKSVTIWRSMTPAEARSHLAIDALDKVTDIVLTYRPKAKSKPARRRKRRATKIAKEK
jgi:hypothetical protein